MQMFKATTYAMGIPRGSVTFQASSPTAAMTHPKVATLGSYARGEKSGLIRVVGIERLGARA